jgi:hypothetical protein
MAAMHEQDFRIERFDCRNFMLYINLPLSFIVQCCGIFSLIEPLIGVDLTVTVLCCMHFYFQCDVNVKKNSNGNVKISDTLAN